MIAKTSTEGHFVVKLSWARQPPRPAGESGGEAGVATDAAVPQATARRIGVPQGMDRALGRVRYAPG